MKALPWSCYTLIVRVAERVAPVERSRMPAAAGTSKCANGVGCWKRLGAFFSPLPPLWIPVPYRGTGRAPTLCHRGRGGNRSASVGTVYPGSESGTCFRSNRSCRLAPAHEGMKIGLLIGRGGCVSYARPLPLDSGFRRNDETGRGSGFLDRRFRVGRWFVDSRLRGNDE